MDPLYLRKRLINQNFNNRALDIHKTEKTDSVNISQDAKTNIKNQAENLAQDIRSEVLNPKQLKMNFLAGMERAGYVKKVMNLPKTLPELLMQLQNEDSIVQEEYTPKYNQEGGGEKNNKEQPKSDIREGVIRNAKETFEGVKDTVKGQIEAGKPSSLVVQKESQQQNNEVRQPSSLVANEESPNIEQPTKPVVNQPTEQPRPNVPQEEPQQPINQPTVPNKTPQNTEVKHDSPQPMTPTTPQNPSQPISNKPIEQPINKPVINQPTNEQPRPSMPEQSPIEQPIINKPVVNQPEQQPQQPVNTQPTIEQPKPNVPQQPTQNIPQQPRPNVPQEEPQQPINQPSVPNKTPQNTEVKHDSPQPMTPTTPQNPSQPISNKPAEQPPVRPNMPNVPEVQPQPINKPVINQPQQETPVVQNPVQTPQQPVNNQPKPNVPQNPQPNIPNKPTQPNIPQEQQPTQNIPQQPRPSMPDVPHVEQPQQPVINQPNVPNTKPQPNVPQEPSQPIRPNVPEPHIDRPEPRPELPNYRPFDPIHHPEMNNMRPNTIMDNRAAIIQNQINQNMPFIKPEDPNRHHHHLENRPHLMDETPKPENIQPQIIQNTQTEPTMTEMKQKLSGDATELFFTGLINLNDLSSSLKDGSKSARSKLIMAMANASRQGIDNSQINDTMKLLNAGLVAEENSTPSKILKNIIELYLPWYPLQQGVGFDLSIETTPGGSESFLSTLKVWIQTRNYGNVNAILALMAGNSVDMSIKCAKLFPKDDLLKRLKEETSNHSMQSNINVEEISRVESYMNSSQQAKVNLSSTYELNPYLLLMAHSFIKNTIIIDSSAIIG